MAHFSLVETRSQNLQKNSVLLPIVCPHWTFYSQQSSVLCHIPTRDVKNSCRMWALSSVKEVGVKTPQFHMGDTIPLHCLGSTWRRASKPHTHNSTWETPYHALHCFSSTWRSRRQETTILCGEHNSMIFWHNIGRTWRSMCQKTTIPRKVHNYTHCSTIEECSRMEDMKKQVSKGYNSTSHMAGLQSEVELQCNLLKKRSNSSNPTFPTPSFLFCRPEKTSQETRRHPRLFTHLYHFLLRD